MIYKNIEIHNAAELIENGDGSVSWKRVPNEVHKALEGKLADKIVWYATGGELRFVIRGENAVIRMSAKDASPGSFYTFHVFRGGIQGGWRDHEIHCHVTDQVQDFVIERSKNIPHLKEISEKMGTEWDPEVVRVIFDRGSYKLFDVIGDVVPPTPEQKPKKTLLCYGSSITHGSNSIDQSHSWPSLLGHNLNMDVRNLGMAGSCALEPDMVYYIASEGERGAWDAATLELGINVLSWGEEKITERVENILRQVAGRNPEKPIFVISPFYHCGDDYDPEDRARKWRRMIGEIVEQTKYPNVTYINGFEILDHPRYMSADEVHPNIYGVQRIADLLTEKIRGILEAR